MSLIKIGEMDKFLDEVPKEEKKEYVDFFKKNPLKQKRIGQFTISGEEEHLEQDFKDLFYEHQKRIHENERLEEGGSVLHSNPKYTKGEKKPKMSMETAIKIIKRWEQKQKLKKDINKEINIWDKKQKILAKSAPYSDVELVAFGKQMEDRKGEFEPALLCVVDTNLYLNRYQRKVLDPFMQKDEQGYVNINFASPEEEKLLQMILKKGFTLIE